MTTRPRSLLAAPDQARSTRHILSTLADAGPEACSISADMSAAGGVTPSLSLAHSAKPVIPRDRLLRLNEVESISGCKKSTIYKLMKEGKFPACIRVTSRMSAWPESQVLQWVQARIQDGGSK